MESEPNSNLQTQSLGNLAPAKRRLTATELKQIQKLKRESSNTFAPLSNQKQTVTEYNRILAADEVSNIEINTSFQATTSHNNPFQMSFPNFEDNEYRDGIPATSSNSNSMMNFFSALADDRIKRQNTITETKKEKEKEKDEIYKWTPNDVSLKTGVTFLSAQPFDHIFESNNMAYEMNFLSSNPFMTQSEGQPLRPQYKFTRQQTQNNQETNNSDFFNAMRSVYSAWKKERSNKFYILMRGITCLFLHQPENGNASMISNATPSKIPHKNFSSMVMIASEKKIFQQTLIKNGINFDQYNNKENEEEAEIMEKIPLFESQTAFTKSFDFANNLEIYFIRKKHVQAFFNLVLTETDSESQFEILAEYPFANSSIFYPKIAYNGPIRLNEMNDGNNKDEMVEESPNTNILKQYKIFEEERTLKLWYKLQIEGCILPLTLKALIENVETKQKLMKATVNHHFITEKFNLETLNPF